VVLPAGITVSTGEGVVIRRSWLRRKHWFLLVLVTAAAAYVAYLWATLDVNAWLVVGSLFVASWNYSLAAMFVNSTVVSADEQGVRVKHGPLPSVFARNAKLPASQIEQLYATKYGGVFAVEAKLRSGETKRLVAPLVSAEQALFVEQRLERALGLVDVAVQGELGNENGVGQRTAPARASSGPLPALLIPGFMAAGVALFSFISSTEVSGRLRASGSLGTWVFEPDDCTSGQREGFGGVVLTASKHRDRVVRVVQDPVRGGVVVVAAKGLPNHVLSVESCTRLDANVERTTTNINDIWVVDGSVSLECRELSGSVTFAGCH
jgi:hypothetical protein